MIPVPNLIESLIRKSSLFKKLKARLDKLKSENTKLKAELNAVRKQVASQEEQYQELRKALERMAGQYDRLYADVERLAHQYDAMQRQCDKLSHRLTDEADGLRKDCLSLNTTVADVRQELSSREKRNLDSLHREMTANQRETSRQVEYYYFMGLQPAQYPGALEEWYFRQTGHVLDLAHPHTYNEKIQWLKLYDSTRQKADLTDKYQVRSYVKEKIGEEYLVPLLGVWDRAEDIPFDDLPDRFALKATHGSGWNIIVHDKSRLDVNDARQRLNRWLRTNFAFYVGLELHYSYIKPRIIAEEYIENARGDIDDYKVFCFHGKPRYILFITGRHTHMEKAVYDTDWNRMPFLDGGRPLEQDVPRPPFLSRLLSLAETLSQGFIHVRVDFYCLNNGQLKFGELTFTPTSGRMLWKPEEYDRMLGDLIHLPCDEKPQE